MKKEKFEFIYIEELYDTDDFTKWSVILYGLEIMHIISYKKENNILQFVNCCDIRLINDVFECEYDEFKSHLLMDTIFKDVKVVK